MVEDFATRLAAADRMMLTPLVEQALCKPGLELLNWGYEFLHGGFGHWIGVYGIYRFSGMARTGTETVGWSLILKALGSVSQGGSADPTSRWYWKREALVYQSDILDNLPVGISPPRCFAVVEQRDDEVWIWLEDIREQTGRIWPLAQYEIAARYLGRFNGAYLVGRPLPSQPWLTQGAVYDWLPLSEPYRSYFDDLRAWSHHPLAQRIMPEATIQGMMALWMQRDKLLHALAQLPRCFCHHDAFRRNLLVRHGSDGEAQVVAIDWSFAGSGAVGEEAAKLLIGSLTFLEVSVKEAAALATTIHDGYLAGLQAAGWQGEAQLAHLGYTITAALIGMEMLCRNIQGIHDEMPHDLIERSYGHSIDAILTQHAELHRFTLDLGDEAQRLIEELDL